MDIYVQALVMGIVQGLTEFLPISSSGHLIIVPFLFGWDDPFITSLAFSVMLHIGTLAALLVYFRADWLRLVPAGLGGHPRSLVPGDPDRRLAWLLVAATIPAAIAGFLLNDLIETAFREVGLVAVTLVVGARRSCGWPTAGAAGPRASSDVTFPVAIGDRRRPGARARARASAGRGSSISAGALRRARPRGGGPLLVPDGDPDHGRRGALRDPQAGHRRGRRRRQPRRRSSSAWSRRSCPGCSRSASCCATCGRAR